jgi:hypothetical protein
MRLFKVMTQPTGLDEQVERVLTTLAMAMKYWFQSGRLMSRPSSNSGMGKPGTF